MFGSNKHKYYIGIDEVGRGPIAGPVTLGVFCVAHDRLKHVHRELQGITDSKKLSEKKRNEYYWKIKELDKEGFLSCTTCSVSASLIDRKGIVWAINTALHRALFRLVQKPKDYQVFLDGGLSAPEVFSQETIIKGDQKNWLIAAASVFAKVVRDEKMKRYATRYPGYGFAKHKGYGTKEHREAIEKEGLSPLHRSTWIK